MVQVLSKEAELKAEVSALKASVSSLDQKGVVLSKELGHAQGQLKELTALREEVSSLKSSLAVKEAEVGQLKAAVASLQAHAAKADSVLEVARGLKSLLANV